MNNLNNVFDKNVSLDNGKTNDDALITANPTKMILDAAGIAKFKDEYKNDPSLKEKLSSINAVNNNQVYLQMPFNAYYTNLEIALMDAYFISSIAYPEKYINVNLEEKYNEISEKFLGVKCFDLIKSKPTCKSGFQNVGSLLDFMS